MLSYTVTLTDADTNYNLLTLVRAGDATFVDQGDFVIQADDDGGSQIYKLGGSTLSATVYGQTLLAGDFSAHFDSLKGVYMRCNEAGKKVAIQVFRQRR